MSSLQPFLHIPRWWLDPQMATPRLHSQQEKHAASGTTTLAGLLLKMHSQQKMCSNCTERCSIGIQPKYMSHWQLNMMLAATLQN